jgi:hypothetical protein
LIKIKTSARANSGIMLLCEGANGARRRQKR